MGLSPFSRLPVASIYKALNDFRQFYAIMDDLGYTISIAFSGNDLTRAIWLCVIGMLLVSKYMPPGRTTLLIVFIDRAWPFIAMGLSGYDLAVITDSLGYAISTLPADALVIALRGLVFYAAISIGYIGRLRLHGKRANLVTAKR